MLRKLRNRARQAARGRVEINLDGFELGLSFQEITDDLNYDVRPIADTSLLVQDDRPEVRRVA